MLLFVYCRKESQLKVSVHTYIHTVPIIMYCHNASCLFVVECTYVAIKRETEQFVRAVAQRYPGQEAPVSSIAQYVCESSTKCCHFTNSLGPNQFSGTIMCGVCNWSRFVVKG